MNEAERRIADELYQAIQDDTHGTERSLQSKSFQVGVSDLGFCSERTRRMLDQQVPEETDMLPAWIGTALGDYMERAALRIWPDAIRQADVQVHLDGEERSYTLPGHPDLVLPEGIVLDFKTDYGLEDVRRSGPSRSQQFQRHMYAYGAHQAGLFHDGVGLDQVQVGNVWLDRSAKERALHVHLEPYDPDIVRDAGAWLDEVVYNYLHQQEAPKEPPREMCAVTCGYYKVCRALDTDVEGLLTDQSVLNGVDMYLEGTALKRQGQRLQDQAKVKLNGVRGSTGDHLVRWTLVNPSTVSYQREAYLKLQIQKVPGRRK